MSNQNIIRVRFKVDDVQQQIKKFTFQVPKEALGARLNLTLTNPLTNLTDSSIIDFELGVKRDGNTSWYNLVKQGSISGKQGRVEYDGGDKLTVSAVNALADRWKWSPRNKLILYDPFYYSFFDVNPLSVGSQDDVVNEEWDVIEANTLAVANLSLRQVLNRAYIDGCKFTKVVTNIEDYPIRRVDFGIDTTWHSVAQQYAAFFNPVYFADDDDVLYILDIDGTLPTGMTALVRTSTIAKYRGASFVQPEAAFKNAILLTFKQDWNTDDWPNNATDRVTTVSSPDTNPGGKTGFQRGWSQQSIETHFKEFHEDINRPNKVTRSIPWKFITISYAAGVVSGLPLMTSRETIIDFYSHNFRLKTGYDKVLEARVPFPWGQGRSLVLGTVLKEVNRITWVTSVYNPDEFLKLWEITEVEGMVLYEGVYTGGTLESVTSAVPILQASTNRQVTNDGFQSIFWGPISTVIEFSKDTGTSQVDVLTTSVDHLIPQTSFAHSTQTIGDRAVRTDPRITRMMLIRDLSSEEAIEPREPEKLNAGEVPFHIAYPIAQRRLKRRTVSNDTVSFDLRWFDANLRRGSLRKVDDRVGNGVMHLVLGFTIQSTDLGSDNPEIFQTVEGIAVVNS